jgi:thioredoxin 1
MIYLPNKLNSEKIMANSELIAEIDDENFQAEVSKGVVLVDFSAEWCGPCRALGPILDEVAETMKGKASIVKVDIDTNQASTVKYGVTSVPTLILFKDGEEKQRVVGVKDTDTLVEMINAEL